MIEVFPVVMAGLIAHVPRYLREVSSRRFKR